MIEEIYESFNADMQDYYEHNDIKQCEDEKKVIEKVLEGEQENKKY